MRHDPQFPAGQVGRTGTPRWLSAISALPLLFALIASTVLLFLPIYSGVRSGPGGSTVTSATLLQVNGPWMAVHLVLPVLLTAVVTFARGRFARAAAATSAVTMFLLTALALASIGMFYVPATAAAIVAVVLQWRRAAPPHAAPSAKRLETL